MISAVGSSGSLGSGFRSPVIGTGGAQEPSMAGQESGTPAADGSGAPADSTDKKAPGKTSGEKAASPEEQKQVAQLKSRDEQVRAHEAAHMAAGGQYVSGGASYTYTTGPDGKRYAVGGEVSIDTSDVPGDPAATAAKMQVVKRAALAPANPSGQDLQVAAQASQREMMASMEAARQKSASVGGGGKKVDSAASSSGNAASPRNTSTARAGAITDIFA